MSDRCSFSAAHPLQWWQLPSRWPSRFSLPTAVRSVGIAVLEALSFFAGLTLEMIARTRQELKRLVYLSISNRDVAERPVETARIDEDLCNE